MLSEEAHDDLNRLRADRVWIIDPLDGTRGVLHPAARGLGGACGAVAAHRRTGRAITDAAVALPARRGASQRHRLGAAGRAQRADPHHRQCQPAAAGALASARPARHRVSAGWVRRGQGHGRGQGRRRRLHPCRGQWEWDSAAPAGVLQAAGLHATRLDGSPLRYNRPDPYLPDLLMCRPEIAGVLLEAMWAAG